MEEHQVPEGVPVAIGTHNNLLDSADQVRILTMVSRQRGGSVPEGVEQSLRAAVMQCTAWGQYNAEMVLRLAELIRRVEDGSFEGCEGISLKLAELCALQLQDNVWSEEALRVKRITLQTMRELLQHATKGFGWMLMAAATESAQVLAQLGNTGGLGQGEALVAREAARFLSDWEQIATGSTATGGGSGNLSYITAAIKGGAAKSAAKMSHAASSSSSIVSAAGAAALPSQKKFPPRPEPVMLCKGEAGFGLTLNNEARIMRVTGPAAAAGVVVGSQIIAVNDSSVTNKKEVMAEAKTSGDQLHLTILPPWDRRSRGDRQASTSRTQSFATHMSAIAPEPEPEPVESSVSVELVLELKANELLVYGTTISTVASSVEEVIRTITERLLTDVSEGLGNVFIARAMDERRSQAHVELTGKPLTGKLAVPITSMSELLEGSVDDTGGSAKCLPVQIWLKPSGWDVLDECRRAVAAVRTKKAKVLAQLTDSETEALQHRLGELDEKESVLVKQLRDLQGRQQRAQAAAIEELPSTLRKQSKIDLKQRLQSSFKLLFEARGFPDFCSVAESFYRILNEDGENEQAWMGLDEVAEANLEARTFVFFKVHDQAGDLYDAWVRAEATELASVHIKRANAKLSHARTQAELRQCKDLYNSAQRLSPSEEAREGLKLTEELQVSVQALLDAEGHRDKPQGIALVSHSINTGLLQGRPALRRTASSEEGHSGTSTGNSQTRAGRDATIVLDTAGAGQQQHGSAATPGARPAALADIPTQHFGSNDCGHGVDGSGGAAGPSKQRKNSVIALSGTIASGVASKASEVVEAGGDVLAGIIHPKNQQNRQDRQAARAQSAEDAEMCKMIFELCDHDQDGFLDYKELEKLARCTAGTLTAEDYIALCAVINAEPLNGLAVGDLLKVYTELGWGDVRDDFKKLNLELKRLPTAATAAATAAATSARGIVSSTASDADVTGKRLRASAAAAAAERAELLMSAIHQENENENDTQDAPDGNDKHCGGDQKEISKLKVSPTAPHTQAGSGERGTVVDEQEQAAIQLAAGPSFDTDIDDRSLSALTPTRSGSDPSPTAPIDLASGTDAFSNRSGLELPAVAHTEMTPAAAGTTVAGETGMVGSPVPTGRDARHMRLDSYGRLIPIGDAPTPGRRSRTNSAVSFRDHSTAGGDRGGGPGSVSSRRSRSSRGSHRSGSHRSNRSGGSRNSGRSGRSSRSGSRRSYGGGRPGSPSSSSPLGMSAHSPRRSKDRNDHEDEAWSGWDSDAWSSSDGEDGTAAELESPVEVSGHRHSFRTAAAIACSGTDPSQLPQPPPLPASISNGAGQQMLTLVPVAPASRGNSTSGKPNQNRAAAGAGITATQMDRIQTDLLARIETLLNRQPVAVEEAAALYQEYIVCEASMMGAHKRSGDVKSAEGGDEQPRVSEDLRNAAAVLTGMMYRA